MNDLISDDFFITYSISLSDFVSILIFQAIAEQPSYCRNVETINTFGKILFENMVWGSTCHLTCNLMVPFDYIPEYILHLNNLFYFAFVWSRNWFVYIIKCFINVLVNCGELFPSNLNRQTCHKHANISCYQQRIKINPPLSNILISWPKWSISIWDYFWSLL